MSKLDEIIRELIVESSGVNWTEAGSKAKSQILALLPSEEEVGFQMVDFLHTITIAGENEPNIPHQQVIFKREIPAVAKAISELIRSRL